jgi:heme/copper-type cytochrome/quinol oxidase subunit 1
MYSPLINFRIFLIISGVLLILLSAAKSVGDLTFDIHLHDTYYIIPWRKVLKLAGVALLTFGVILHLRRKLKTRTSSAQ